MQAMLTPASDPRLHPAGMASIPAGDYPLGSQRSEDEGPVRTVRLTAFSIDVVAVTNEQFAQFIDDDGYRRPEFWTAPGYAFVIEREFDRPSCWQHEVWGQPGMPVTGISWWEARAYANWRDCDLPTEAQWEAACRGASNRLYPWGDAPPTPGMANYAPSLEAKTGTRRPSRWDAYPVNVSPFRCVQMAGNLAEWCLDNYDIEYHITDGSVDPCWLPDETAEHVTRGGSSIHPEDFLRCSARDPYPPGLRDNFLGLRCVLSHAS